MTSADNNPDHEPMMVATAIAKFIHSQGVQRVYTLPGSHVKPICSEISRQGMRIVSARHECSAVHMAHAEAILTGVIGVGVITTGPGLTNAITGITSAYQARTPMLVLSARVPDLQAGMGALEEIPQADLVRPVCRYVQEIRDARQVLPALQKAVAMALGSDGPPGPVYLDFGANLLKEPIAGWYAESRWFNAVKLAPRIPEPESIQRAAQLLRASHRPLVIGGRGALEARPELEEFLGEFGCVYLDTRESRGAVEADNPSSVPAMRARAMAEADLVITLGRRLDFELAYGSAAVFSNARHFIRIGRTVEETSENRRAEVEIWGDVKHSLQALLDCNSKPGASGREWRDRLLSENAGKSEALAEKLVGYGEITDQAIHPLALISALNGIVDRDTICIVDGGDILSFARVGLQAHTYLDLGPFGCLGSGAPYAVAAALAFPGRQVIALMGDGAFGFSAMEIETAVRCGARALFVIANNDAWNIERQHQVINYPGQDLGGELSPSRYDLLAQSLGAHGERVENYADLAGALQRGLDHLPAVIDVAISRDAISPDTKSGLANLPALHAIQAWDDAERRMLEGSLLPK